MNKIKSFLKNCIYNSNLLIFGKKILLESSPDFSDNTKFVFDEMIKEGLNNTFKLYWIVSNKELFDDVKIKNVKFVNRDSFYFKYLRLTSKVILDSNNFISKCNKNQLRIYLTHGMPLKLASNYFNDIGSFDYITVTSDLFKDIFIRDFNINKDKIVCTGYPRNDYLFNKSYEVLYPDIKRDKTIIWMPTYRNHKNPIGGQTGIVFKYGIPCISNENELIELNNKLKKSNILLIIKLHPAEDTSKLNKLELSSIKILDNSIIENNHKNIYDYLLGFDALITDYSSIYYDYIITGRKIGLAIPDIEEYSKHVKLAFTNFEEDIKAFYIKKYSDIIDFINYVSSNKDSIKKERDNSITKFVKYNDGKCSKRVIELINKHLGGDKVEK